jgi:hypothetical protein
MDYSVNVLPFRAYALIYQEYFRSQNLDPQVVVHTDDLDRNVVDYEPGASPFNYAELGCTLPFVVNKLPDYFTSCLPGPQKGPAVALPLGEYAPVVTGDINDVKGSALLHLTNIDDLDAEMVLNTSTNALMGRPSGVPVTGVDAIPDNLKADLREATAANISDLRLAFQLQKLYERDARGGTRYTELLLSHFGVSNADASLQRPQLLGGHSQLLTQRQVQATADTDNAILGDVGAYGLNTHQGHSFTKSFTEHGFIIGLVTVRVLRNYQQGLNRLWSRRRRFDYYWPALANIGEQPVYKKELYLDVTTGEDGGDLPIFGYQEYAADYRFLPSRISGYFLSGVRTGSLDLWHYADDYASAPSLSSDWLKEDKSNVDRTIAVTSAITHQYLADFAVNITATRAMPQYSVPGMVDHN